MMKQNKLTGVVVLAADLETIHICDSLRLLSLDIDV
jgi:hypothetical protein